MSAFNEHFKYAALGDSSGVGVGAGGDGGYPGRIAKRMKSHGVKVAILNLSQSGATSADVLDRQARTAASKRPDLITLGVGTNDLWRMVPLDRFRENLRRIADHLEAAGAPVLVSNIPDLSLAPVGRMVEAWLHIPRSAFHARVESMNGVLAEVAARPRFVLCDLFGMSRRELSPEHFCEDGFHPSAHGYERWADLLWPFVSAELEVWRARRAAV